MKIGIIGNGILALTTARELSRSELVSEITVFGTHSRKMAGSAAAAAMLNSFAEIEAGYLDIEINRKRMQHSIYSTNLWSGFLKDLEVETGSSLPHGFGTFIVANRSQNDLEAENFDAIEFALDSYAVPHENVDARKISGLDPAHEGRTAQALFIPGEGWVDTRPTMDALVSVLNATKKVTLVDSEVTQLEQSPSGNGIRLCASENYEFDKILVVAGAKSSAFFDQLGLTRKNPKVLFGVGSTIRLSVRGMIQEFVIRTPNRGLACGLYSAPYPPNELLIGATNQVSENEREFPTVEDVRSLLSMAQRELNFNLSDSHLLSINTGFRPISTDGVPLIGKVPLKNAYVCTGTRRDGWHMSPFLSKEVARMMISDETGAELGIYDPMRNPYRLISREKSIQMAARHYVSGMYQHGLQMPFGNYRNHISRNYENFFTQLHDYAGFQDFGIPIDLIAYASGKMMKRESIDI